MISYRLRKISYNVHAFKFSTTRHMDNNVVEEDVAAELHRRGDVSIVESTDFDWDTLERFSLERGEPEMHPEP